MKGFIGGVWLRTVIGVMLIAALLVPVVGEGRGQEVMKDYHGNSYWFVTPMPDLTAGEPIVVTVDFTSSSWNTQAFQRILTISGPCRVRILARVTTQVTASAGLSVSLGAYGVAGQFLTATPKATLAPGFWIGDVAIAPCPPWGTAAFTDRIVTQNVGLTLSAAATGGVIVFYCWVTPLYSTSTAAAGTGEAL